MSTSPHNDRVQAIRTLRTDFGNDLSRLCDVDPLFFAGYVISWLCCNLEVDELGRLVDELDDTVRVDGHRVLDRPSSRARDL